MPREQVLLRLDNLVALAPRSDGSEAPFAIYAPAVGLELPGAEPGISRALDCHERLGRIVACSLPGQAT